MAYRFSTYLQEAILNWFRGDAFPLPPSEVNLALWTTAATADDGTGAVEADYTSYAQVDLQADLGSVAASETGGSAVKNDLDTETPANNDITFVSSDKQFLVEGRALYDDDDNLLALEDTSPTELVKINQAYRIQSGNLTIGMD